MRFVSMLSVLGVAWAGCAFAAPPTQSAAAITAGLPHHVLELDFGARRLPEKPVAEAVKAILAPPAAPASCPDIHNDGRPNSSIRGSGQTNPR